MEAEEKEFLAQERIEEAHMISPHMRRIWETGDFWVRAGRGKHGLSMEFSGNSLRRGFRRGGWKFLEQDEASPIRPSGCHGAVYKAEVRGETFENGGRLVSITKTRLLPWRYRNKPESKPWINDQPSIEYPSQPKSEPRFLPVPKAFPCLAARYPNERHRPDRSTEERGRARFRIAVRVIEHRKASVNQH